LMPTTLTAQNGAVISESTRISVGGCATTLTNAQKLAKALATCRKRYKASKAKRSSCERAARKRYPAKTARKSRSSSARSKPRHG
jgi:hypothetical protein